MRRLALVIALWPALAFGADDLGLRVPPGFRVTLYADHTLTNDIFTMALDEKGRVVVSGPGYVRRLEDTDGDGKADRATDIARTKTGAMGLLFAYDSYHPDTFDLYTAADGKVRGHNGDHVRNLYPMYHEMVSTFPFSEHGGHALKIGPDGYLYAVAGNNGRIDQLKRAANSPIARPEAGGIVRFRSWERAEAEIIAHGFRNPYDFDFTPLGDIITYDSDTERDFLLPWYVPTRAYHVLPGAHHGWRLPGYMRSLARPDYYPDTVPMLADMGRGSPTGVCCYRHTQFPQRYRGGVFLLDWTFGRVYYLPLIPEGGSYQRVAPEVFLEPTGTDGFAPTAARVAPDGSLFISIGGRGTRGGVYRVEYRVDGEHPPIPEAAADEPIYEVLDAPQPLEAWSQARWIPLASRINTEEFERVALSEDEPVERRVRAIEVLTHRKPGVRLEVAQKVRRDRSPFVRARLAWALANQLTNAAAPVLWELVADPHPRVRVAALQGLEQQVLFEPFDSRFLGDTIRACLDDPDHRVRLAAARVVSRVMSERAGRGDTRSWRPGHSTLWDDAGSRALVALVVASVESGQRSLLTSTDLLAPALRALETASSSAERVDAIRAVMLAVGDWNLAAPKVESHSAYGLAFKNAKDPPYFRLVMRDVVKRLLADLPTADGPEAIETTRLLAMVETDDAAAVEKVLGLITRDGHPTLDFHYLTVLSRLPAGRTEAHTERTAAALLALDAKLAGRHLRIKQNWGARLGELATELMRHDANLGAALVAHPDFVRPGHVPIAVHLKGRPRSDAARKLLGAVRDDEEFPLSPDLVELLAQRPPEEVRPVFRARWSDRSARAAMAPHLANNPAPADRDRLLEAVETTSGPALAAAARGLAALPPDRSPEVLRRLLARLRETFADPRGGQDRGAILGLIQWYSGERFQVRESKTDAPSLAGAYRPVFDWFAKAHPAEAKRLNQPGAEEEALRKALAAVNWSAGDVERGRKIYRDRSCLACHSANTRIGPDLAGVSKRLSRDDLLTAIVSPSRDVAPAYRVTNVDLKDGKRVTGVVVFESADGLIVQIGAAETKRIATEDIESTAPSPKSLMPDGLLQGLKPEDLADLFAFLEKQ